MRTWIVFFLCLSVLILASCGGGNPEKVVEQMYAALQEGDTDGYMDTLLPSTRNMPDLDGVLGSLLGGLSFGAGGFGFDLGGLLSPTFNDMEYTTVSKDGSHAVVQARGRMRMMMMEYRFCDTHDLTKESGKWYVNKFHEDRQKRIEDLVIRNQQRFESSGAALNAGEDPLEDLASLFQGFGQAAEVMLDMCE